MEKLKAVGKFARFFVKNYQVTILLIIFLLIGGVSGYLDIPREGFPDIKAPYGIVTTVYPGATPQDVEEKVTKEIEAAVSEVEGIKEIESNSLESMSVVMVTFEASADLDKSIEDLQREALSAKDALPAEAETPSVMEISAGGPALIAEVTGGGNIKELAEYANVIKDEIEQIEGVGKATVGGAGEDKYLIRVDLDKFVQSGVSYDQMVQAIKGANISLPGGEIKQDQQELPIQVDGRFVDIDNIKEIIIGVTAFGQPIKLADIAEVTEEFVSSDRLYLTGYKNDDNEIVFGNSVSLMVELQENTDVISLTEKINEKIDARIAEDMPDNIKVITIYDSAKEVNSLLGDLFSNAWQGLVAILIVLFLFISFRSSIVTALIIPLVMLMSFLVLYYVGLSFNILTLYSLILSLGIVIDNAIVIVEGIQYNLRQGLKKFDATIKAVNDLGGAVIAASLTTMLVFIPMMFLGGITGEFVKYIPYTVLITLVSSLVIALSITPFLGSRFLHISRREQNKIAKRQGKDSKLVEYFGRAVQFILAKKLRLAVLLLLSAVLFVGSMSMIKFIKVEIWPPMDDADYFNLEITYPQDASDEYKNNKLVELSEQLKEFADENQDIKEVVVSYGPFSLYSGFAGSGSDADSLIVNLTDQHTRKIKSSEIVQRLNERFADFAGAEVEADNFASGPPSPEYPIEIQIADENLATLERAAGDLGDYLAGLEGVGDFDDGIEGAKSPQVAVKLDREKINNLGLSEFIVAQLIRNIYQPEKVGEFVNPITNKGTDIKVEFKNENNLDDLKNLQIGSVKLQEIATVEEVMKLKEITRFDQKRYIEVKAKLATGYEAATITNKISDYYSKEKLEELGLKDGAVTFRGDFEEEQNAFDDFGLMMTISIILIYAVLVFQFKSFFQPMIIMLAIPLAIIGVFPALYVTGNPLSFMSLIGIVVLAGIVVNNSIILVDRFNKIRQEQKITIKEAVISGVKQRIRPIFSTTITTIAGILPLTITQFYWRGMGVAIIAGLLTSTFFVLFVVSSVYYVYFRIILKIKKKKSKTSSL